MSSTANSSPMDDRLRLLQELAAAEFRICAADPLEQLRVCVRYFQHGEQIGFTHEELIDHLGISTPCVLDMAGYTHDQALTLMGLLPLLHEEGDGSWRAPDSLSLAAAAPVRHDKVPESKSEIANCKLEIGN